MLTRVHAFHCVFHIRLPVEGAQLLGRLSDVEAGWGDESDGGASGGETDVIGK